MTECEVLERLSDGCCVECHTQDEKYGVLVWLQEHGFEMTRAMQRYLANKRVINMAYNYIGLNGDARVDGYSYGGVIHTNRPIIQYEDVVLSETGTPWDIKPIMSLYL
jgi:hypothetical protein